MPLEAELHADELNSVFKKMVTPQYPPEPGYSPKGHTSFVEDALTYELNGRGEKKRDYYSTNIGDRYDIPSKRKVEYNYVRLLNAEGKAIRAAQGAFDKQGSWHEDLDPYAYNWKETKAGA